MCVMGILGAPLGNGFDHLLPLPLHPEVAMEVCRELLIKQEKKPGLPSFFVWKEGGQIGKQNGDKHQDTAKQLL